MIKLVQDFPEKFSFPTRTARNILEIPECLLAESDKAITVSANEEPYEEQTPAGPITIKSETCTVFLENGNVTLLKHTAIGEEPAADHYEIYYFRDGFLHTVNYETYGQNVDIRLMSLGERNGKVLATTYSSETLSFKETLSSSEQTTRIRKELIPHITKPLEAALEQQPSEEQLAKTSLRDSIRAIESELLGKTRP